MGKAGEAMYSQLGVDEGDADAEDLMAHEPYRDEPYRDEPQSANAAGGGDEKISTKYRDVEASIFDWEDMDTSRRGGKSNGYPVDLPSKMNGKKKSGGYSDFDGGLEVDFAPVRLDEDDDSDEEEEGNLVDDEGGKVNEPRGRRGNKKLQQRVFDETTYSEDEDDEDIDRIFVGGGMGRHGSYDRNCCVRGPCCCARRPKYASLKSGPGRSSGPARTNPCCYLLAGVSLIVLIAGCAYVGYEAGLTDVDANNVTRTNAEEWWEWIQEEKRKDTAYVKEHYHWNFTHMHTPSRAGGRGKKGGKGGAVDQQKVVFEPMTQTELLGISQKVFASCGEHSIAESGGRNKCLSLCHGRYCCFERDPAQGSCVAEDHSYCFAYAGEFCHFPSGGMFHSVRTPVLSGPRQFTRV